MTALNTPISITVTNEYNNIKKQGYLLKQSKWFKKDRKRYCILTNGVIYAYKTNNFTDSTFNPKQATECFNLITDYKYLYIIRDKKQFIISRSCDKKSIRIFTANSTHDLLEWVEYIKKTQPHHSDNGINPVDLSPSTNTTHRILTYNKDKEHQIIRSNSQPNLSTFPFKEDMNDYMCDNHAFYDQSIDNNNKQKQWKCKECYYDNRNVMVGGEWKFNHTECALCGNYKDNNIKYQTSANEICQMKNRRSRHSVRLLNICNEQQLYMWKQIKKNKIYDDIKCDLISGDINNKNRLYFEGCNVNKIIEIIGSVITEKDNKLYKIKNDIIQYCMKQNIDGKKLLEIGRKGFTKEISKFIGVQSLTAKILKLYSRIKKYDIDCKALKRICFVLEYRNTCVSVKDFIKHLYIDVNELLDDIEHVLKHKQILNSQPYIKCTDDINICKCYQRILNQKRELFECNGLNDINYICYLDCVHIAILHNKLDEISDIMNNYGKCIRKYAKYSEHYTKDFVDHKSASPLHKNLKDELTLFDEIFYISEEHFEKTLQSAKGIVDSFEYDELEWKANQSNKEYGIEFCDTIPIECVSVIKLYCEDSYLRRQLRECNNDRFYWIKRYLYIATTFYGSQLKTNDYLFHGLPQKYLFNKFSTILNSPTSTTTKLNVATKYAGDYGIVLKLSIRYKNTVNLSRCLETKSISNYDKEERIFYGMEVLSIIDIIIYNGNKWISNSKWINSILYFERIIEQSYQQSDYIHGYIDKQMQKIYLLPLIQHQMNRNIITNIPEYILVLFEHFCYSKRDGINLSLIMNEVKDMCNPLKQILLKNIDDIIEINEVNLRLIFPNLHKYKDYNGNWIILENNNINRSNSVDSENTETKLISELTQCAQLINMNDIQINIDTQQSEIKQNYENNSVSNTPDAPDINLGFSVLSEPDDDEPCTMDDDDTPVTPIPNDHDINKLDVNAPTFKPNNNASIQLQLSPELSFKSQTSNTSICTLDTIEEKDELFTLNNNVKIKPKHKYHGKPQYFPPNKYRAQGRIHMIKRFTNEKLPSLIKEKFENLYDYMDKLTAIDKCIKHFNINGLKLGVINYGFHHKITNEKCYCVIKRQDENMKKNRNYLFRMIDTLFTANDLENKYNIRAEQLPQSLIFDTDFVRKQIENIKNILKNDRQQTITMIRKTKWQKVPIFKKINNINRRTQSIEKNTFIRKCKTFFENTLNDIDIVPILMFDDYNMYWIEYVWIVRISNDINIGISLIYDNKQPNKIKVNGIHLDKKYLLLQHQLVPWKHDCCCLNTFISSIDYYHIGNPDDHLNQNKNLQKQMKILQKKNEELKKQLITDKGELNGQINTLNNDVASLQSVIIGLKQQLVTQMNIVSSTQMLLTPQVNNYVISIPPYIQQNMKFNMHQNMKQNQ